MFDTIILLTGRIERAALASVFRLHSPQLNIHVAETLAELESLDPALLGRARLIGFVTPVIVPPKILERLRFGAYNFHPGPPHYPGWLPAHFAIYDRAKIFGATAHLMAERVDAGPIVGVELFDVQPNSSVESLEQLAYLKLARIFWDLAKQLATQSEPLSELPIKWSGRKTTRRQYESMGNIQIGISKEELNRRIEAFGGGHFGLTLNIMIHGRKFRYSGPELETKVETPPIGRLWGSQPPTRRPQYRKNAL